MNELKVNHAQRNDDTKETAPKRKTLRSAYKNNTTKQTQKQMAEAKGWEGMGQIPNL